jgi:hypothetical protein
MSDWQYATSESFSGVRGAVDLSFLLTRNAIAIDLSSTQKKAGWNKAGDIIQVIDLELAIGFSTRLEVADSFNYLSFNPTLLKFNILSSNPYRLRFKPVPWLTDFSFVVWQYFGD